MIAWNFVLMRYEYIKSEAKYHFPGMISWMFHWEGDYVLSTLWLYQLINVEKLLKQFQYSKLSFQIDTGNSQVNDLSKNSISWLMCLHFL